MIVMVILAVFLTLLLKLEASAWQWRTVAILAIIEVCRLLAGAWLAHPLAGGPAKCVAGLTILLIAPLSLSLVLLSPFARSAPVAAWAALEVVMCLGLPLTLFPNQSDAPDSSPAASAEMVEQVTRATRHRSSRRTAAGASLASAARPPRSSPVPSAKRLVAAFAKDEICTARGALLPDTILRQRLDAYAEQHQLTRPSQRALREALRALGFHSRRGPGRRLSYLNVAFRADA